jgi:CMP-N-acetylneuraminic acid synthetase
MKHNKRSKKVKGKNIKGILDESALSDKIKKTLDKLDKFCIISGKPTQTRG